MGNARERKAKRYAADLVHELFEARVEQEPEARALEGNGEQLSYAQLERRANRLAPSPAGVRRRCRNASGTASGAVPEHGRRRCWPCSRPVAPTCRWIPRIPRPGCASCSRTLRRVCWCPRGNSPIGYRASFAALSCCSTRRRRRSKVARPNRPTSRSIRNSSPTLCTPRDRPEPRRVSGYLTGR